MTLRVRGQDTIQSNGFSVAAIPINYTDSFVSAVVGSRRGFVVQDGWASDSGAIADLSAVDISEQVQYGGGTGVFAGVSGSNSGYLPATSFTQDTHSMPASVVRSPGGTLAAQQTCEFRDARTGSVDIPMANSGYTITRTVFFDATARVWKITTSKVGAATTANGVSSQAGQTTPAAGITLTQ